MMCKLVIIFVTLYAHEVLAFCLEKITRFKTNTKIMQLGEYVNKAKMKMLTEREFLLLVILRRQKRKPRVWVRQVNQKRKEKGEVIDQ